MTSHTGPGQATTPADAPKRSLGLGPALRRAWVGYQQRLDAELVAAGFDNRGFPDGRVLRIASEQGGATISEIGRRLDITRQGASKIVVNLLGSNYLSVTPAATDRREKVVTLAPRGVDYLAAQRRAARRIERQLTAELGESSITELHRLLHLLGDGAEGELTLRAYLKRTSRVARPHDR